MLPMNRLLAEVVEDRKQDTPSNVSENNGFMQRLIRSGYLSWHGHLARRTKIPGGIGGKEAVHDFISMDPGAKVIVSSGYSNDPVMVNFEDYGFCSAIEKSFRLQELSRVICSDHKLKMSTVYHKTV